MEETIGAAELRDAAIGTGIAVDKMLAVTGQLPFGSKREHSTANAWRAWANAPCTPRAWWDYTTVAQTAALREKEELMLKA
jgi:hypothetical protein